MYSCADVTILDDSLVALDRLMASSIFEQCIAPDTGLLFRRRSCGARAMAETAVASTVPPPPRTVIFVTSNPLFLARCDVIIARKVTLLVGLAGRVFPPPLPCDNAFMHMVLLISNHLFPPTECRKMASQRLGHIMISWLQVSFRHF